MIFVRLVWLQVFHHDDLLRLAQQQQQKTSGDSGGARHDFRSHRAAAGQEPAGRIDLRQSAEDSGSRQWRRICLSRVLDLDRGKLFDKIAGGVAARQRISVDQAQDSADEAERLRSLKLDWVEFRPEMRRFYPHGTAGRARGRLDRHADPDDTIEHGTAGIEASFDDDLAGEPGLTRVYTDVKQNPYDSVIARKPEPGANITLTIDPNLQYDAEKELEQARSQSSGAKTGSIVVA